MKILMAAVFLSAPTSLVIADSLELQYATEVVHQSAKIPDAELEFSEWQQSVSGGYILQFAFDVDGDGAEERFFASSFNAEKLVCEWTIYKGKSEKLLGKGTLLRPDGFWWNPATREMLDYVRFGAEGGSAIFSQFINGGLKTRSEPVALDEISAGLSNEGSPRQGFQRVKPQVTISLLADVVANTDSRWRILVLDEAGNNYNLPNGRLLLAEDASRVDALKNFTPNAALETLQKPDAERDQPPSKLPATSSLPIVQPPTSKASGAKPAPMPSEKPGSSTPWIMIVVLVVVTIGLLLLFFKKRK